MPFRMLVKFLLAYPCRVGIFDYLGSSRKSGVVFGLVLLRHYSVSCIELSHFPSCSQILPVITIFEPGTRISDPRFIHDMISLLSRYREFRAHILPFSRNIESANNFGENHRLRLARWFSPKLFALSIFRDGFLRNCLHFLYFANLVWILGSIPTVGKIPSPLIRVNYLDK